MWNCNVDESCQGKRCPLLYADPLSTTSDTMDARMDSIDSATDTRGSDEPWICKNTKQWIQCYLDIDGDRRQTVEESGKR